jgi:hypothetical protein
VSKQGKVCSAQQAISRVKPEIKAAWEGHHHVVALGEVNAEQEQVLSSAYGGGFGSTM